MSRITLDARRTYDIGYLAGDPVREDVHRTGNGCVATPLEGIARKGYTGRECLGKPYDVIVGRVVDVISGAEHHVLAVMHSTPTVRRSALACYAYGDDITSLEAWR